MKHVLNIILICLISGAANLLQAQQESNSPLRKPKNDIYVIAHRGIHDLLPENSLPAYAKAVEAGCDFVEIDVRTTKDSNLVSIHNSSIEEYDAMRHGKIKDMTMQEILSIDLGHNTIPEHSHIKIPTLDEILQLCHGKIGIYLDLKDASVRSIVNLLSKYGMEKDVLWYISANDRKNIKDLRELCPKCHLMPDFGSDFDLSRSGKINVVATDMDHLTRKFIRSAHRKKILVFSDDSEGNPIEWKKMIDMKVDGIQTDNPERLIRFLDEQRTNRQYLNK
jgi:glycerophosphoryl diester phosphodiesterase